MPDFAYTARDAAGQKVTGTLSAPSEREALSTLAGRALFPLQVQADTRQIGRSTKRIKPQLISTTYGQLASLMRSGVPLLRALAVLRDQSSNPALKEVISQVHAKVEEGETLAEGLSRYPRAFGEMAVNMIRAGGEGGFLEDALDRVAMFTEQQEDLKGRTAGALAYPLVLASVGTVIITALVIFLVPLYEPMFGQLRARGELPVATEILLSVSSALKSWPGFVILGAIAALVVGLRQLFHGEEGRWRLDRLKLRVPMLGGILLNMAVARFCRVLGTLLSNGVPILRSLQISSEAAGNRILADAIQRAAENISSGESLAAPLAASGHFPRDLVEMITVAEEANTLETVLINIADTLERRTWRRLDLFVRFLEPLMLMLIAGAVLFLAIALLLPVMMMTRTML